MPRWKVAVEQNGDEYTGWVLFTCMEVVRDENSNRVVYADGMRVEFDEKIIAIRQLSD